MRIKAAILTEIGRAPPYAASRPLSIEEVELEDPGAGEVLVRVRAAGLCHSDLSVIDGNRPRPVPMVLGHEAAGEVVSVGAGVEDLKPGDHVVAAFVPCCGHCAPCLDGRPALCEPGLAANTAGTLLSGRRRLRQGGREINHHLGVSAFAEYAVLARESLVAVDPALPFEQAALFGCAVMTGVGAVFNTAAVPQGSSIAVVGLGGVGLAALLGARTRDPSALVAVDLSEQKLAVARELGATITVNAGSADAVEQVREATRGGVEYAFEMAGAVAALDLAYRMTRRGGTTVTAGLSHPDRRFSLPHLNLVAEERTLKGSYLGSCAPSRDIPRYATMHIAGELPVDRLLSERVRLEQLNEAFDRLAAGTTIRQVVVFD
jgi:alcohol dehydrogenase